MREICSYCLRICYALETLVDSLPHLFALFIPQTPRYYGFYYSLFTYKETEAQGNKLSQGHIVTRI